MSTSAAWELARVELEREKRRRVADGVAAGKPLWSPLPGPQSNALNSEANITGFGGSAGGGKSDWLLGLATTRHRNSIVFRREYGNLLALIERTRAIVGDGGRYNSQTKLYRIGDKKTLEFGAVQFEDDKYKYRGRPHDLKAFDELTEFTESQFRFLIAWNRTTLPDQRCRVIATFNPPTSAEGKWVIKFFGPWLDRKHPNPAMPGELRWYAVVNGVEVERPDGEPFDNETEAGVETIVPLSRTFFPARLKDNPFLMQSGYGATLQALPEPLRSQMLYGDFDAAVQDDPWQVIPTAWVEAAMRRWKDMGGAAHRPEVRQTCIGMDVAHGGSDATVLAPRYGDWFAALGKHKGSDTPDGKTAAALAVKVFEPGSFINVDAIGYGASAAERLIDRPPDGHGLAAFAVNVALPSEHKDRSGKYKMRNIRAEMYWRLREDLDPEFGSKMALPDDPELLADLTAPTYEITSAGIKIEAKDEIKKRIGRSPDCGDAVALATLGPKKAGAPSVTGPSRAPVNVLNRPPQPYRPGMPGGGPRRF
jgi:hypothetical protein